MAEILKFAVLRDSYKGIKGMQDIDMLFRKTFNWQQDWIMDGAVGKPNYGFNGSRNRGFLTLAAGFGKHHFFTFFRFSYRADRAKSAVFNAVDALCPDALLRDF